MNKNYWRLIEYCKVTPRSVIFGSYWRNEMYTQSRPEKSLENLKKKKFTGDVSKHVKKRISRAIDNLILQTPWKKTFCRIEKREFRYRVGLITLTLPSSQIHDDNQIKNVCLNDFLNKIRNNHDCKNYIWKAEPQKNGNIHFHITIDKFIHHTLVRKYWLSAVEKLGYVTAFAAKFGHYYPPATEIRSVRSVKKLGAYLSKYLAKDSKGRKILGRLWSLSYNLSKFQNPTYTGQDSIFWEIDAACNRLFTWYKKHDFCEMFGMDLKKLMSFLSPDNRKRLESDYNFQLAWIS
jgi:hypothetical protein